jgi:hypothetical protein
VPASAVATPSPPAAPRRGQAARADRTCLAAIQQADAVISYLIGDVRDRRLEQSLYAYVEAARDCREEAAP